MRRALPIFLSAWAISACATLPKTAPCGERAFANSDGRCVPKTWVCAPLMYHGGVADGCDCNCGADDPDCHVKVESHWCYGMGMARRVPSCALCDAAPGQKLFDELMAEP